MDQATGTEKPRSIPLPAALFLVTVAAFWPTLVALPGHWNSYNEHGWVVAGLVTWLIWRDRQRIADVAGVPDTDLFPVLGLGSVAWLLARVMGIDTIHQTLFILLVFGWAMAVFGRSARSVVVPIAATAMIAAPIWDLTEPLLQRAAVVVTGAITAIGGVEAEIGAYTIGIATGTFIVEAGCSGLNYLLVSVTLAATYVHLFVSDTGTRIRVILVAICTALVSNWIRISALVFVGDATAMQSPLIDDHLLFGWAIFTVMLVPGYFAVRWVERRSEGVVETRAAATGSKGMTSEGMTSEGVTSEGLRSEAVPGSSRRLRAARVATIATVAGPVVYMVLGILPRPSTVELSPDVFAVSPSVQLSAAEEPSWTPTYQGIDGRADWVASTVDAAIPVHASRFWFVDQRQGEEMVQGANSMAPDSLTVTSHFVSVGGQSSRIVQETVFYDVGAPRVAWSWYRVAGRETPFARNAKLLEVWAWLTRAPPSELLTLSAPCDPDSCESAARALREIVSPGDFVQPPG